ncbi:hypothetical protein DL98DRAFT_448646 [Cadophora sp. DSE1049]|nr:hypothetical protein DL98DRAFT_448646 [Cadophora sp. DSE1049]
MSDTITSYYPYDVNHVLPIVFAVLIGISLALHTWQNFRYHYWTVMFFIIWAGTVFTAGWIMRCISSYSPGNKNLYIAQNALILGGPPIYSAVEYNILGRLMFRLPMHAPFHPNRVVVVFIYLGAAVETLTAVGAVRSASAGEDMSKLRSGLKFLSISLVLQCVVELLFMATVALIHYRCVKANMLTSKVRTLVIMLYGTSLLILIRGIFRSVESFSHLSALSDSCGRNCVEILTHEWYIYVFEAAPVVLYTYWLNIVNPGRILPKNGRVYLDFDGVERLGPGWIDRRSQWQTFADPLDFGGVLSGNPAHDKFWERPDAWEIVDGGSGYETHSPAADSMKRATAI